MNTAALHLLYSSFEMGLLG